MVADAKRDRVYVADPHNKRIEVFDTKGALIAKWPVPEWQREGWSFQDLAIDPDAERIYLTSPATDEVLVYDLEGKKIAALKPPPPNNLEGVSALALGKGKLYVVSAFADRIQAIDLRSP